MGNAYGRVINDTNHRHRILTFNYGDEIRHEPDHVYDMEPFQTCTVTAEMCPIRGLVVSTGVAKTGKHMILEYDGTIKMTTLLQEGNDNPAYEDAIKTMLRAKCRHAPNKSERMSRCATMEQELKEQAAKAEKKYNRKPGRCSSSSSRRSVARKGSKETTKTKTAPLELSTRNGGCDDNEAPLKKGATSKNKAVNEKQASSKKQASSMSPVGNASTLQSKKIGMRTSMGSDDSPNKKNE